MKRDNVNYLLVGSFVLLMGAVLFYALFRITGHSGKGDIYHTHFPNVAGIKEGSVVTFEGFEVGNVAAVAPAGGESGKRYRVTLNLRKPVKIPVDSRAVIATPGLLAAPLVEIKEGKSTEILAREGVITGTPGGNLMESVATLAAELNQITETGIKPLLAQIGKRVDSLGNSLDQNVPGAVADLRSTLARLNSTAGRVESLFSDDNRRHLSGLLKNADETSVNALRLSRELHGIRSEIDGLLKDSRAVVNANGKELQLSLRRADTILYQLESAGRNLNEFSRTIRENPSALVQSRPPADAAGEPK